MKLKILQNVFLEHPNGLISIRAWSIFMQKIQKKFWPVQLLENAPVVDGDRMFLFLACCREAAGGVIVT